MHETHKRFCEQLGEIIVKDDKISDGFRNVIVAAAKFHHGRNGKEGGIYHTHYFPLQAQLRFFNPKFNTRAGSAEERSKKIGEIKSDIRPHKDGDAAKNRAAAFFAWLLCENEFLNKALPEHDDGVSRNFAEEFYDQSLIPELTKKENAHLKRMLPLTPDFASVMQTIERPPEYREQTIDEKHQEDREKRRISHRSKLGLYWPEADDDESPETYFQLKFSQRKTEFIGRRNERERLHDFIGDDPEGRKFLWWQIAGAAGQGKTRLALQFMEELDTAEWDLGFASPFNDDVAAQLLNDIPNFRRNILIVVDYIAAPDRYERFFRIIRELSDLTLGKDSWGPKIRLLAIERQPYRRIKSDPNELKPTELSGAWQDHIFNPPFKHLSCLKQHLFDKQEALLLGDLEDQQLRDIASEWSRNIHGGHELTDIQFQDVDDYLGLTREARKEDRQQHESRFPHRRRVRTPLFAMIAAEAAINAAHSAGHAKKKGLEDLLVHIFEAEAKKIYGARTPPNPSVRADNLAHLANIIGTVNSAQMSTPKTDATLEFACGLDELEEVHRILGFAIPANARNENRIIHAREPDILAEYQVLRAIEPGKEKRFQELVLEAWSRNIPATFMFLLRAAQDFSNEAKKLKILLAPPTEKSAVEIWAVLVGELIAESTRREKSDLAQHLFETLRLKRNVFDTHVVRIRLAQAAFTLSYVHGNAGDLATATDLYDEIKALAAVHDEAPLREQQAKAAVNLINIHGTAGDLATATDLYDEIKALAAAHDEAPLREQQAKAACNLIFYHGNAGDLAAATDLYDEIKALAAAHDQAPLREWQASAAFNLIVDHGNADDLAMATDLYEEIKALAGAHPGEPVLREISDVLVQALSGKS